jgi:hypothetical protein
MPGSSTLFAILRCSNQRNVVAGKPRSFTYDAEMVISVEDGKPSVAVAALNHFADAEEAAFIDGAFYVISGRIASIDSNVVLGNNPDPDRYEFLLDADLVSSSFSLARTVSLNCLTQMQLLPETTGYPPLQPRISISGAVRFRSLLPFPLSRNTCRPVQKRASVNSSSMFATSSSGVSVPPAISASSRL